MKLTPEELAELRAYHDSANRLQARRDALVEALDIAIVDQQRQYSKAAAAAYERHAGEPQREAMFVDFQLGELLPLKRPAAQPAEGATP